MKLKKGRYQHYKGADYHVIDTVIHSETEELLVLYRPLYGEGKLWVRPYEMFFETVNVNGEQVPRFAFIEALKE
ncbi:DUF1653 domain-containing protein [Agarivorans sp. TSD2052]|uniref:DUF1653 domain-containing protein n=1 Tax=Agarivorans sp. TSD2052 TaxID=2937286 RepID=UPI00200F81BE|nr:DUF1653 domain-containing protein [Agarivorans sp. TSD2052]UPW18864.1 DUF1653 domain-containing protein [Agarivorans sp. TSD2052]